MPGLLFLGGDFEPSEQDDIGSSDIIKNDLENVMDCAVCETRISVDFGQVSINGDFFCVQCITHANNVF